MAAGSIVIDLLMKTGSFETDSKRAEKRLRELEKTAYNVGAAIGTSFVAAGTMMTVITKQAIDFADQIGDMSQTVGVSTETLSAWGYAAKMSGTDIESLAGALPKLAKNIASASDAGSASGKLFAALGMSAKDATGKLRSVEDVLPEIADKFQQLDDDTTKAALAQQLFGKSGTVLLQFLNRGSAGIAELSDRARDLGIVIGQDTADAAGEFNDRIDDLLALVQSLGLQVAEQLLPSMTDLVTKLEDFVKEGDGAVKVANAITATLSTLYTAATYIAGAFDVAGTAIATSIGNAHAAVLALTGDLSGAARMWEASMGGLFQSLGDYGDTLAGVEKPSAKKPPAVIASWDQDIPESMLKPRRDKGLENRLSRLLGGSGKSSASSEAEKLSKKFDQLIAQQEESIALFGQQGEAAKMAYQLAHGELSGLGEEQKKQLQANAEWQDWLQEMADIAEIQADASREVSDAKKRQTEVVNDLLKSLNDEMVLLGLTADQQEIYNALTWAGVEADTEAGRKITETIEALQRQREALGQQVAAMDSVRDAGKGLFKDIAGGEKPLDAVDKALDSIKNKMLDMIAQNFMDKLFGKSGDPAGGWLGSLFGSSGKGDSGGGWLASVASWGKSLFSSFGGGKAGGGDVLASRPYLVGEQGPEMFVPRTTGAILPADTTATLRRGAATRQFNQTLNVSVAGRPDRRTPEQIARAAGRESQRAMRRNG